MSNTFHKPLRLSVDLCGCIPTGQPCLPLLLRGSREVALWVDGEAYLQSEKSEVAMSVNLVTLLLRSLTTFSSLWLYRGAWHRKDVSLKLVTQYERPAYVFDFKRCSNNGAKMMRVKYSCRQGSALFKRLLFVDEFKTLDVFLCVDVYFYFQLINVLSSESGGIHLVTISSSFLMSFEQFRLRWPLNDLTVFEENKNVFGKLPASCHYFLHFSFALDSHRSFALSEQQYK